MNEDMPLPTTHNTLHWRLYHDLNPEKRQNSAHLPWQDSLPVAELEQIADPNLRAELEAQLEAIRNDAPLIPVPLATIQRVEMIPEHGRSTRELSRQDFANYFRLTPTDVEIGSAPAPDKVSRQKRFFKKG